MLSLSPISRCFLDVLNRKKVKYLLVGGHAAQYYGSPRTTRDLDIWVDTAVNNAEKLVEVLKEFGVESADLTSAPFQLLHRIVRIDFPPLSVEILEPIIGQKPALLQTLQGSQPESIELLTVQTGTNFDSAYASRVILSFEGVEINIVNKEHLKLIKGSTDRPKDIQDLISLQ